MKVVFIKDVSRVGRKYEVKEVSDGYGRNFLIKNGYAVIADAKSLGLAEGAKKETEKLREAGMKKIEEYVAKFKDLTIKIVGKANEEGHLFAGIKREDLLGALLSQAHIKMEEEYLVLPKPIKTTGEYDIELNMEGKKASFKLIVEAEK